MTVPKPHNLLKLIVILNFITFVFSFCSRNNSFEIISFDPVSNKDFKFNTDTVNLIADLTDAPIYGIVYPTTRQTESGKFVFSFKVNGVKEKLFYKIFYQNASYKFSEDNKLSYENFYGSWEETETKGFKEISGTENETMVTDSFRIVGNPRNESVFFGSDPEIVFKEDSLIEAAKNRIRNSEEWYTQVAEKASQNKISTEEQLHLDALWVVNDERNSTKTNNNRWKRNPRVGQYEFLLVLVNEKGLKEIPYYIKNIGLPNYKGNYVNPFSYFMHGKGKNKEGVQCFLAKKKLNVAVKFDLMSGIYINKVEVNKSDYSKNYFNYSCGDSSHLYYKAHFQQYFHNINRDFPLLNISEIRDVVEDNMTQNEYYELKKKYDTNKKFFNTYVNSSDCPCKTVKLDSTNKSLVLINPGNKSGELKKEHVGIKGRIGLTYGKWRAKIKFPKLINKNNVWNGITAAYWLIAQNTEAEWNKRRECNAEIAYIPKNAPDNESALNMSKRQSSYSEIDFEILKESQYWPQTSYGKRNDFPKEDATANHDITVTCTNWDLACHEPKNFTVGVENNKIDNMTFAHHRWNQWYKALTTKVPISHKDMFEGDYYYFEIEWRPDKIIWKVGPEKDRLKVICIMDETVTAVPNNQMVAIITQEWHNQEWWPVAPFKQNYIPFPKKDIIGKVLEIEVE